jgi:hypothetical protein
MTALAGAAGAPPHVLHLSRPPCRTLILQMPGPLQHVLVQDTGRCLQFAVEGADILGPARLVTDTLVEEGRLRAHLGALGCLNDFYRSGRLLKRHFPPEPRGERLTLVLQALDGWRAGASHREIAEGLFGRARVEADWGDPGDHLRDRTRRAVRRGRVLMEGGYRQFLR